ncbi:MAG: catalase family protein [Paludisphaera borealis]|uniref:catalase family protein n=1 Tax=Paludisphaera borealis TaxID=1387353 RepID=UPI002849F6A7|nr:catalase family protein [Paludisphaera borealis]MDR3619327.1 catalase family protein [Paludisphaera borealis]
MVSGNAKPLGLGQESIPASEAGEIDKIVAIHLSVTDPKEKPIVPRGQHMKGHGCVKAKFEVAADLPADLRRGVFAEPRSFDAYIRFSNGKGSDDRQADAHGMAIKLVGVPGAKLLEDEKDATTQDFILFDNPVFFIKNVADYVPFMEDFRNLKSPGFGLGKVASGLKFLFSQNYIWKMLREAGSKKPDSPLRIAYWSTTPYKLGDAAVKYRATPDLAGAPPVRIVDSPDKLRLAAVDHLRDHEARFDFFVQVQTDPVAMPVEDPTVAWTSPFQKVATIRIPAQEFDTPERRMFGENLSYTPWHALPDHRPLGGINRSRKWIYQAISKQRHELNGVPRREPTE